MSVREERREAARTLRRRSWQYLCRYDHDPVGWKLDTLVATILIDRATRLEQADADLSGVLREGWSWPWAWLRGTP